MAETVEAKTLDFNILDEPTNLIDFIELLIIKV